MVMTNLIEKGHNKFYFLLNSTVSVLQKHITDRNIFLLQF